MILHTFYLQHDNEQAFELLEGGANLNLARYNGITRITIDLDRGPTLDSAITPNLIKWGDQDHDVDDKVVIEGAVLAEVPDLLPGRYGARVVVYSLDQPKGIVFLDYLDYRITIHGD
ncbi:MAG: hypothetical protein H0U69_03525 [Trueperaceae bacterium]|nr:hypothetical protein [Trueperaceae bacterium]